MFELISNPWDVLESEFPVMGTPIALSPELCRSGPIEAQCSTLALQSRRGYR